MKRTYLQIPGAFVLGLLVVCAVLQIGARVVPVSVEQSATEIEDTTVPTAPRSQGIRVLQPSGETVEIALEDYLVGVILAEMPTSYDPDALCAQAVVARTYALKRQKEGRHPNGAICTDSGCCQAYVSQGKYLDGLGYPVDVERATEAVIKTSGEVLTYQGELVEATYFHCSGGFTEDAVEVWGVSYPYLQAIQSPGEENMEYYRSEVYFSSEQMEEALNRQLPESPWDWIGQITYTQGGGVDQIEIAGVLYTGLELRDLLKLNSTAFAVLPKTDGILITTSGKGHRVGMSQSGAQAMAMRGYTYLQILGHYYPGTVIDKLDNMG